MGDFTTADRELLHKTEEVGIEIRAGRQLPIWIVVDGDNVYVRSVRGIEGRWYQAMLGGTRAKLYVGQTEWTIKSEQVADPEEIERVNQAIRRKYEQRWPQPTAAMLRPAVVPTTLRIAPA